MSKKTTDQLEASVARLSQAQQALVDLKVWVPLQAIEDQLKAAVESVSKLRAYREQVEEHQQIIEDAFILVEKDSKEIMADIEALKVHKAQEESKGEADQAQVLADPQGVCTFNVGGHVFKIRKQILLKSPDSRLAQTMQAAEVRGGDLVVDRDPERFRHVLNFLRDDFKASNLSVDKLREVIEELQFWEIDKISQISLFTDLNTLLSKDPEGDLPNVHPIVLGKWKELGPLSVDEILAKAGKSFVEGFPIMIKKEKRYNMNRESVMKCQINPETQKPFGIGRYVDDGIIIEGFFEGDHKNGWFREIYDDVYCMGQMKDGSWHGQVKRVAYSSGFGRVVEEGHWEELDVI